MLYFFAGKVFLGLLLQQNLRVIWGNIWNWPQDRISLLQEMGKYRTSNQPRY